MTAAPQGHNQCKQLASSVLPLEPFGRQTVMAPLHSIPASQIRTLSETDVTSELDIGDNKGTNIQPFRDSHTIGVMFYLRGVVCQQV